MSRIFSIVTILIMRSFFYFLIFFIACLHKNSKTHTLTGKRDDPGLIPLCVKDCFRYVRENMSDEPREYLFRFSYLEIYKEHIRDLLSSTNSAPEPVRLFDGPDGLVIRGVKEVVVSSPNKVFQLLKQGDRRRQVGATHMNQHSSRSHVVVRLQIESSFASSRSDETRVSVLSLVDLAGSESVRLNGADRREEGQYINKSLMALGQVVLGLSDPKKMKSHIPYRDSKLTRLLQSSLSGNAQMLMMCCISPEASHLEESHNTFKFATRAKRIEQKASIKTAKDTEDSLLQTYRNEIENLKKQLAEAAQQKEQLLAEQQAFQTIIEREEVSTENNELTEVLPTSNKTESSNMESTNGEIEGLVEAIQTMEQLILKSLPLQHNSNGLPTESGGTVRKNGGSLDMTSSGKELDGKPDSFLQSEDVDSEGDVDLLLENDEDIISKRSGSDSVVTPSKSAGFPPTTPHNDDRTTKDHLHSELTRVRGILATVLRKRGLAPTPRNDPPGVESFGYEKVRKSLDFSTPSGDPPPSRHVLDESLSEELNAGMDVDTVVPQVDSKSSKAEEKSEEKNHELESLRIQLKQQERATNLRKADSHFLQLQLEEKDKLLEEVSSLLEAVEKRQGDLEQENLALRRELNSLREERGEERSILIRNSPF